MINRSRWVIVACLALGGVACSALFGETSQCATNDDCKGLGDRLVCGDRGTCVTAANANNNNSSSDGGKPNDSGGATDAPPANAGILAKILVSPSTATVNTGASTTFYATATDAYDKPPSTTPVYTWSVSGGGTMDGGVFTAGNTAGGPFTVTCTSGTISGTAQVTVGTAGPTTITIGEVNVLNNDDMGNMDLVLAQEVTLNQAATIKSLSFYVGNAAGKLKLGIYDDNNGQPNNKKAETAEFDAVAGAFNTQPVMTQVLLPAGNYWLAYAPSDSALSFKLSDANDGKLAYFSKTYDGTLPDQFDQNPTTDTKHWTFYATLTK